MLFWTDMTALSDEGCLMCGDMKSGHYWCAYDVPNFNYGRCGPVGFCPRCVPGDAWDSVTMYYETKFIGSGYNYTTLSLPCAIEDDGKISIDLATGIRLFTVQKI